MKTAPAVHPNAGVTAWYRIELQAAATFMARDLVHRLRDVWIATIATDAKPTKGAGFAAFRRQALMQQAISESAKKWSTKLDGLSLKLSLQFADKARTVTDASVARSFKTAGLTTKFKPTLAMKRATNAIVAENVALIRSIPVEFHQQVAKYVRKAIADGGDLAKLTATLQKRYGVTFNRAALIARDQNAKAKAMFERVRRKELGITDAIWQHSHAGEVPRPTHVAMNGLRYNVERGMFDPDPKVQAFILPGELISCRCTSRAVIEGFE